MSAAALTPREIRRLPPLLVNQIAAGEVIERPASVVKELVENSLDAGAGRIEVTLERGGIELIRVADDGCGMTEAQLPLAVAPHATSKVARAEDLDRIGTMGFRGEALASIASIARVCVRSRTETTGPVELRTDGGSEPEIRPASGPVGTTIEVRNLFYNTPARRKFLRTPQTEQSRCLEWIRDLAMAHPAVGFACVCDSRRVIDLPAEQSPRARVLCVLGEELEDRLVEVSLDAFDDARGVTMWGLVGLPDIARATAKHTHAFLNGRAIRDRTVQHALREAYRGLMEHTRWPTAALMLEMSPGAVDVNVHPAKLEVRFRDQSMVHSAVLHAVRDALRRADLTPQLRGGPERAFGDGRHEAGGAGRSNSGGGSGSGKRAGFFETPAGDRSPTFADLRQVILDAGPVSRAPGGESSDEPSGVPWGDGSGGVETGGQAGATMEAGAAGAPGVSSGTFAGRLVDRVLQVHNAYLVTADDDGIVLIDQHALHERVMFEQLRDRLEASGSRLESQRLLTPASVRVTPDQIERLDELSPLLERIGLDATPTGPRSIGVHAFPSFLFSRAVDPVDFMHALLGKVDAEGFIPSTESALHEVLDMMACKAAVKAGDKLTDAELSSLLQYREAVERSSACPHGRPTSVRLSLKQLEKMFHRG